MRKVFQNRFMILVSGFPTYSRDWAKPARYWPFALHRGSAGGVHLVMGRFCLGLRIGHRAQLAQQARIVFPDAPALRPHDSVRPSPKDNRLDFSQPRLALVPVPLSSSRRWFPRSGG